MNPAHSSPDSGLYLLILKVDSPAKVRIGAIGLHDFRPGYYAYCGSARKALSARLKRHAARKKKKRWHIDYLTCRKEVAIESTKIFPLDELTECRLNAKIIKSANASPIRGFGCSDCKCVSHLAFLGPKPPGMIIEYDTCYDS